MDSHLQKILDALTRRRVTDYEIYFDRTKQMSLQVQKGRVESFDSGESVGFSLRVLVNGSVGFSYGTDFSDLAISIIIDRALSSASFMPTEEANGWVMPGLSYPAFNAFDEMIPGTSLDEKIQMAKSMEEAARTADRRIKSVRYGEYGEVDETIWIANSQGLLLTQKKNYVQMGLMAVAEEGDESEMAYESIQAYRFSDLKPQDLGRQVAKAAASLLGGRAIPNYSGPIVIDPRSTIEMIEVLAPSALSDNIHKKNSFLIGKLGKKIYADTVTFIDDGLHNQGLASASFDGEGAPRQTTEVIKEGVVTQFLYDQYWAKRDGICSTGNCSRESPLDRPEVDTSNFYLKPGKASPDELLRQLDRGVMVTDIIGMHTADAVSGDFSLGIQGFWVEGGKVAHPIRSVALTGNLHELFGKVKALGSDLKFDGTFGAPSILVEEASISGDSA